MTLANTELLGPEVVEGGPIESIFLRNCGKRVTKVILLMTAG